MIETAITILRHDEGIRYKPYDDYTGREVIAKGNVTIGVGRNLSTNPLSDDEVDYLLCNDIRKFLSYCNRIFKDFNDHDDVRGAVLIAICFWFGHNRLGQFRDFIHEINKKQYHKASEEFLATQTIRNFKFKFANSKRPNLYSQIISTGVLPNEYKIRMDKC
jgi:GH24 family phage-related lysozyme (muramidase)